MEPVNGDTILDPSVIPADWPVQPIAFRDEEAVKAGHVVARCGDCGLCWDDSEVTGMTPAPAGRCPFEAFHVEAEDPLTVVQRKLDSVSGLLDDAGVPAEKQIPILKRLLEIRVAAGELVEYRNQYDRA